MVLAGLLHDTGALSLKERLDILQFEIENPYKHAELGYLLLKDFELFSKKWLFLSVTTIHAGTKAEAGSSEGMRYLWVAIFYIWLTEWLYSS
ncbi:MAG: hypothetical protein NC830_00190 [Candidatus Omnitrophica bacterium]|nr:hypothetical protein [Candidatus Omnitrophota bacterium]